MNEPSGPQGSELVKEAHDWLKTYTLAPEAEWCLIKRLVSALAQRDEEIHQLQQAGNAYLDQVMRLADREREVERLRGLVAPYNEMLDWLQAEHEHEYDEGGDPSKVTYAVCTERECGDAPQIIERAMEARAALVAGAEETDGT